MLTTFLCESDQRQFFVWITIWALWSCVTFWPLRLRKIRSITDFSLCIQETVEETVVRFNFLENNVFKLAWLYVKLTMVFFVIECWVTWSVLNNTKAFLILFVRFVVQIWRKFVRAVSFRVENTNSLCSVYSNVNIQTIGFLRKRKDPIWVSSKISSQIYLVFFLFLPRLNGVYKFFSRIFL